MTSDELPTQKPSSTAITAIAVIDDALIPIALANAPASEHSAVRAAVSDVQAKADLAQRGFDDDRIARNIDEALEALTDPSTSLGEAFVQIAAASERLATLIQERRNVRQLVKDLEDQPGIKVLRCDPTQPLPDLSGHQLVFIDYYLEGSSADGSLAERLASEIQAKQVKEKTTQQIILMSSVDRVRNFRKSFRERTHLHGAAFGFIAKSDLDEKWKVTAQLAMLSRALPHGKTMANYLVRLDESISKAKDDLFKLIHDLDLGDYAYLQSQALGADGHPLGDYLSWLLSSHLGALVFETDLRELQAALDAIEFEPHPVVSTEPSPVVANLYHSAIFSRNHGPLGPHPRAPADGQYSDIPLVQLGDVFFDASHTRAIVVLSAACDLAFAPSEARAPDKEIPVILVPGTPVSSTDGSQSAGPATYGVLKEKDVYRIDWKFSDYRSVELGNLKDWLTKNEFELGNRDRLRPLYGLKLQQEFGAHLFRVGPPVMPPVMRSMKGSLYRCISDKTILGELDGGDVMVGAHKGVVSVTMTPALVGRLRSECRILYRELEDQVTAAKAGGAKENAIQGMTKRNEALQNDIDNDEFWIGMLGNFTLNAPGVVARKGQAIGVVRGNTWDSPNKPGIVLEILDEEKPNTNSDPLS
jgi:hypothetical protein